MTQKPRAILLEMLAEAHSAGAFDDRRQLGFALDQRRGAQIITVEVEEIERVEYQALGVTGRKRVLQR